MREITNRGIGDARQSEPPDFAHFRDINEYSNAIQAECGLTFDFPSVIELGSEFVESSEQYLILNIQDYDTEEPNHVLFLTHDKAFLYARNAPSKEACRPFLKMFTRPYGRSTVLAFLVLSEALESSKRRLEALIGMTKELDINFDYGRYRDIFNEFERLYDRLEEFHDLILKLQERGYKQVQTRYISFDYSVLLAESSSLEDRCRRRINMLREVARDYETQVTTELNKRIERLNDVVKRLTAVTVILMLPTLVASHFGMNFRYMPELGVAWAYPVVIAAQVVLMGAGLLVFRKIGWI